MNRPPNKRMQPTAYRAASQGVGRTWAACPQSFISFSATGQPCGGKASATRGSSFLAQDVGG